MTFVFLWAFIVYTVKMYCKLPDLIKRQNFVGLACAHAFHFGARYF